MEDNQIRATGGIICFKNFFKKQIPKYEVYSLMSHESYVDEKLEKMQNDGWEIAGDILLKNKDGHCTHTYFHIPLKRRIKR